MAQSSPTDPVPGAARGTSAPSRWSQTPPMTPEGGRAPGPHPRRTGDGAAAPPSTADGRPAASPPPITGPVPGPPGSQLPSTGEPRAAPGPPVSNASSDTRPADDASDDDVPAREYTWLRVLPAWLISMVTHLLMILLMALVVTPVQIKQAARELLITRDDDQGDLEAAELVDESKIDLGELPQGEVASMDISADALASSIDASLESLDPGAAASDLGALSLDEVGGGDLLAELDGSGGGALSGALGMLGGRSVEGRKEMVRREGGTDASEQAVAKALKWLANHQRKDGSWSFDHRIGPCQRRCRHECQPQFANRTAGATALALLPFLGAGQTHKEGEYKKVVERGLMYLGSNMVVTPSGGDMTRHPGADMYDQGLATIALCEAFAMTQDEVLYGPAQACLNFVVAAQDPYRGGWWYQPSRGERSALWGDTSVVGWQLMALKSGSMARLHVPVQAYRGAGVFLDSVQSDDGATYGYMEPSTFAGNPATTAAGLLCRMYMGWDRYHPPIELGVRNLLAHGPNPQDVYYNYYATQVLHHYGGDEWKQWNVKMRDMLVETQSTEKHETGSWYNNDRFGYVGGRLYTTCMSTMVLEVYYRHMPLYDKERLNTALEGLAE